MNVRTHPIWPPCALELGQLTHEHLARLRIDYVAKGSIEIAGMQFLAKEHMRHFDGWQKLSRIIQEQSDEASKEFISAEEESVLPELEMVEQLKVKVSMPLKHLTKDQEDMALVDLFQLFSN